MIFDLVKALDFNLSAPLYLFSRVQLTKDVALLPHTTLLAGETGTVMALQEDIGGVWQIEVLLDTHHDGLHAWGNEALLAFPELSSVVLEKSKEMVT